MRRSPAAISHRGGYRNVLNLSNTATIAGNKNTYALMSNVHTRIYILGFLKLFAALGIINYSIKNTSFINSIIIKTWTFVPALSHLLNTDKSIVREPDEDIKLRDSYTNVWNELYLV